MTTDWHWSNYHYVMNNFSFVPPNVPVILQVLSGAKEAKDLLPSGSVITLPRNKVIEIVVNMYYHDFKSRAKSCSQVPGQDESLGG